MSAKKHIGNAIARLACSLLLSIGATLSGCIIIPTPTHGGKNVIPHEAVESFEFGKTTRAEILLKLGDPDKRWQDDRIFIYSWKRVRGYVAILPLFIPVPIPGNWGAIPLSEGDVKKIESESFLKLEFADDNRLRGASLVDR